MMIKNNSLPIAIIGGGPVGLAAAAHLTLKGEEFIIFESGNTVGASVLEWGHVRMFSPWQYNIDKASKVLLEGTGWTTPNQSDIPTGKELVENYLQPLSMVPEINRRLIFNAKVVGVAKKGLDKLKTSDREARPFQVYVEIEGETKVYDVKTVIDASGTWKNPNPMLSNGIWTKAERNYAEHIHYGIPNVLGELEEKYANKNVIVIGSGHSAINALLDLAALKEKHIDTTINWVIRKSNVREVYGGQEKDNLPARGSLGIKIQQLVESKMVNIITPFYINDIGSENGKMTVKGDMNGEDVSLKNIDEIVVSTGFRPDTTFLNELRLRLDPSVESVEALAPLIDPNVHSCGTVRPHGEQELKQPEQGFYIVGMKSYGRAPTFLLATGYEQVRSVVAYLSGDLKAAREVHLELPETGVCSVGITSCCDNEAEKVEAPVSSCCGTVKVEIIRPNSCS